MRRRQQEAPLRIQQHVRADVPGPEHDRRHGERRRDHAHPVDEPAPGPLGLVGCEVGRRLVGEELGDAHAALSSWKPRMTPETSRTIAMNSGAKRSSGVRGYGKRNVDHGADRARARRHHEHAGREEDRLQHGVRDEEPRELLGREEAHELLLQALAQQLVDGRERLVEEQQLGPGHERTSERRPHLHAARELVRQVVLEARQSDELQGVLRQRAPLLLRHAVELRVELHVAHEVAPGEQVRLLEHAAGRGVGPQHAGPSSASRVPPRSAGPSTCRTRTARRAR